MKRKKHLTVIHLKATRQQYCFKFIFFLPIYFEPKEKQKSGRERFYGRCPGGLKAFTNPLIEPRKKRRREMKLSE